VINNLIKMPYYYLEKKCTYYVNIIYKYSIIWLFNNYCVIDFSKILIELEYYFTFMDYNLKVLGRYILIYCV